MKRVIDGYWAEDFDGLFDAEVFYILDNQVIDGVELDCEKNNHPACALVGAYGWEHIPELKAKADALGIEIDGL